LFNFSVRSTDHIAGITIMTHPPIAKHYQMLPLRRKILRLYMVNKLSINVLFLSSPRN